MTLFEKLKLARSEEDVKALYIKALGLKGYSMNLIDIQTKEIWFEAKDGYKHSTYAMFTQLLHYVQQALDKGEYTLHLQGLIFFAFLTHGLLRAPRSANTSWLRHSDSIVAERRSTRSPTWSEAECWVNRTILFL